MEQLKGTGIAIVTPFKENLEIDFDALTKIVMRTIENDANYLVVLGSTAESVTLSFEEKNKIIAHIKTVNQGRLPLVLSIGGNNTATVLSDFKQADLNDFIAVLSVSPSYNRPSQEGIYQHYKQIALASDKPIILYNVPSRTGSNIEPKTVLRLAKDFKNIIGVKEASGNINQSYEILQHADPNFLVISGDDALALPITLGGGSGVISVIAQSPTKVFSQMIQKGLHGDVKEAFKDYYKLINLINLIYQEGNPTGIKALLAIQGLCEPYVRLPLIKATDSLTESLKNEWFNFKKS